MLRPVGWLMRALRFNGRVLVVSWVSLAFVYSNFAWAAMRLVLAVAFAAFGILVLWGNRWPLLRGTFFFFHYAATTEIYTLSLHDALPTSRRAWNPLTT